MPGVQPAIPVALIVTAVVASSCLAAAALGVEILQPAGADETVRVLPKVIPMVLNLAPADQIGDDSTLELDGASGITTFQIGSHTYAAVASFTDDGVQILNVTDPSDIAATDQINDNNTLELNGASGITTFQIGSHTYAAVASFTDSGVQILNVTDPSDIAATDQIGDGGTLELVGASGITTFQIGTHTYAAVASFTGRGVQILDVTDPSDIAATDQINDNNTLELNGASGITTFQIGTHTYAAVASSTDDGVQILDVTDPSDIAATDQIGDGGSRKLVGARGIATFQIGTHTYAAVAANFDDGVQILNVTDPRDITATDQVGDGGSRKLNGARGIATFLAGGHTYAAVASNDDDGVQILNVTDPRDIAATYQISDGGSRELNGARGIATFLAGGQIYAAVASFNDDGVQILQLTADGSPNTPDDPPADSAFITTWETTGANEEITIPGTGAYDVAWGDGTFSNGTRNSVSHTYATAGTYTVSITGGLTSINLGGSSSNAQKLQSIKQWGEIGWTTMQDSFYGASAMVYNATDAPDLSGVTNMTNMFRGAAAFDGNVSGWDVSGVTDMYAMFAYASSFNRDLNDWNVSQVTDIGGMFFNAVDFNQPLSDWNVSGVTRMSDMFGSAHSFNQPLSDWDVSQVTDMNGMFRDAAAFNGDVSSWNVSKVTGMHSMFRDAAVFNGDLSGWDVSNVTGMSGMFWNAAAFNGDVSSWNVSKVTNMNSMFNGAAAFNQSLSSWDVSKVMAGMNHMFYGAAAFNGNLSSWDVSRVTDMNGMFRGATSFNGNLSSWDVSRVTDMNRMFASAPAFNGNVSSWDVSRVTDMNGMFASAPAFNGNVSSWDVSQVTDMGGMFSRAASFNGNVSSWDVSQVTDMGGMFLFAASFNQPLSGWNVSQVTYMGGMFEGAASFNQPLNGWNVSQVTNMGRMFSSAFDFNQPLSSWNVSKVTSIYNMFQDAASFNQTLNDWNVSQMTDMNRMFFGATSFNQPLSSWDVSRVTDMNRMFSGATSFNQPLSSWDVSRVTDMNRMFSGATSFNQPLSSWGVSRVTDMNYMFRGAAAFNQDLSSWDVSRVTKMSNMFTGAASFDQNLGNWYVVPADTAYAASDVSLNVTTISAQNVYLDGHSPTYGIGSGDDSALFNMTGSTLMFNDTPSVGSHAANVTASDGSVFENGNNWRELKITVAGADNTPPEVDAGADLVLAEGASLTLSGSATDQDAGDTLAYSWSQNPATPAVGLSGGTTLTPTITAPSVESSTVITLTLTVNDGTVDVTDEMDITVRDTAGAFITTWETTGNNEEITIPGTGTYDVVWGDGQFSGGASGDAPHTYATPGTYTVSITGGLEGIRLSLPNAPKLQSIEQWGGIEWTTMRSAFQHAGNMKYNAADAPDLSGVTDMDSMFFLAGDFNGDLSSWNVSKVTDMGSMFRGASDFNGDVSSWNVSQVTDMSGMFSSATAFNKRLSSWDVSQVTDMSSMFTYASSFNRDLNDWNVSKVTRMPGMFQEAIAFNKPLSDWNVSQVDNMSNMFASARSFQQNLGNWYVVPADAAYATSEATLNVTTISAQNSVLDGHSPEYDIGSGDDSALFNMTENVLTFKAMPSMGSYAANVTASGSSVFENGNNWRELKITVAGADNNPPNVDAGADQTVGEGDTVTLSGSAADPDAGDSVVSYSWSAPQGSGITFADASSVSTTFTAPAVDGDATFTLTLTAGDGTGTGTDTMDVTVKETSGAFITTWSTGSSKSITIPGAGTYDVVWGDGQFSGGASGSAPHTYATPGTYTVSITGGLTSINLGGSSSNAQKLQSIEQWGGIEWTTMRSAFQGASNMEYRATGAPDLSGVVDMTYMFRKASSFDGDLSSWNVSKVTTMILHVLQRHRLQQAPLRLERLEGD